jgi:hypothetical protein
LAKIATGNMEPNGNQDIVTVSLDLSSSLSPNPGPRSVKNRDLSTFRDSLNRSELEIKIMQLKNELSE